MPGSLVQPLTPTTWPQDKLVTPSGFGVLPPVNEINRRNVRREYYGVPFLFSNINSGQQQQQNLNLQIDGDFWWATLYCAIFDVASNTIDGSSRARLNIIDVIPQYSFFSPYLYIGSTYTQNTRNQGAGPIQNFIEPYCFIRGSTITVSCSLPVNGAYAQVKNVYGILSGWKEYEHATA